MSDSASHLAKEARGLHQGLKELLKSHNPWDKEVEFGRKNLRRQYLRLLLVEPYAKESKDAETHLWMQTSYQFISHYKQSLATLDRTLQTAPRHQPRQDGHGPVEYRKLIQRFRQFLAEEEKFWIQFIARYQRSFALHDAHTTLLALNILSTPAEATIPNLTDSADSTGTSIPKPGRNNHSFPPEDSTPALDPAECNSRLAILSKAIVCLGDIARYRELYNESGGRPKAGHEDDTAPARRGGRSRRGAVPGFESIPRARNYDRAIQCYEQARLLVPYEGNASHQLAILAFYQNDMFSSLLHYYRALCVQQPYDTASENVKKILSRALDQQAKKIKDGVQSSVAGAGEQPPRLRVDQFKEKAVLLHALWRLGSVKVNIDPVIHADNVAKDFMGLVSERILPIDTVSRVVVLSQGALWKHRMIRDASPPSTRKSGEITDPALIESLILAHVIAVHSVLLDVGATELAVPPEDAAEDDLAQRITAPFRRTLPALRIASKWLVANVRYVLHAVQAADDQRQDSAEKRGQLVRQMCLFWSKFAEFYSALSRLFPVDRLPTLMAPLDEDIDLKGFLPLRNLLVNGGTSTSINTEVGAHEKSHGTPLQGCENVHPNEEQLMRISDLLKDARGLAEREDFPICLQGDIFVFDHNQRCKVPSEQIINSEELIADQILPQISADRLSQHVTDQDDDAMTDTGRTDDDPVGDAFRQALDERGDSEDDEDGEVILWNPRALGSPPTATTAPPLPTSPALTSVARSTEPSCTTQLHTVTSPRRVPKAPPVTVGTTAQDLLNNVMGLPRSGVDINRSPRHQPSTSAQQPQQHFLFGSGPQNIWSTSLDQHPPPALSSMPMGMPSDVTPSQRSLNLSRSWSPPFESIQARHPLFDAHMPQSPRFPSLPSFSAVSSGHHRSMSSTPAVGQRMQQLPSLLSHHHQGSLGAIGSSGRSYTTTQPEYRSPMGNASTAFVDPAIVSVSTPAQVSNQASHSGSLIAPYRHYPKGHVQQQQQHLWPAQETQPPLSHSWRIHG
ncbi:hypothetical protein F5I97DRAFT_1900415 [Phlebopus sp. FC_14]|nr:hypothetical protein F5I97DRAFT_1900415 [Phlebopus sp. FC_14]